MAKKSSNLAIQFEPNARIMRATLQPPSDHKSVEDVFSLVKGEARRVSEFARALADEIGRSAKRTKQQAALARKIRERIIQCGIRAYVFDLLAVCAHLKEPTPEDLLDTYAILDLEQFNRAAWVRPFSRRYAIGIAAQMAVDGRMLSKRAFRKLICEHAKAASLVHVNDRTLRSWMASPSWTGEVKNEVDRLRGVPSISLIAGPVDWSKSPS